MRKIVTIMTVLLLLTALPVSAKPRKGIKGQIHVSRVELFSQDGKTHLKMRVTYSTDLMNRGERMYVTPRLTAGGDMAMLASMVFDGKSRKVRVRDSEVIVVADSEYGHFHFDIEYLCSYYEWMQGVSLEFYSEEVTRGNVRNTYLDTLYEGMLIEVRE